MAQIALLKFIVEMCATHVRSVYLFIRRKKEAERRCAGVPTEVFFVRLCVDRGVLSVFAFILVSIHIH